MSLVKNVGPPTGPGWVGGCAEAATSYKQVAFLGLFSGGFHGKPSAALE